MTADEFLALPECEERYELVDGVVILSPAAGFGHQRIAAEILYQISAYLDGNPIGAVVADVDVRLRDGLVYRPDIVFLRTEKAQRVRMSVTEPPDLVVEIVSPDSRQRDIRTKHEDYEAAGVGEYWVVDPGVDEFHFFQLSHHKFVRKPADGDKWASHVLPGFMLDLARIRRLF